MTRNPAPPSVFRADVEGRENAGLRSCAEHATVDQRPEAWAAGLALCDLLCVPIGRHGPKLFRVHIATGAIPHANCHQTGIFESAEYQRIADRARTLSGLIGEGAYVKRADVRAVASSS